MATITFKSAKREESYNVALLDQAENMVTYLLSDYVVYLLSDDKVTVTIEHAECKIEKQYDMRSITSAIDNLGLDHEEVLSIEVGRLFKRFKQAFAQLYPNRTTIDYMTAVLLWLYNRASETAFTEVFGDYHTWNKFNEMDQNSGKFWLYLEKAQRNSLIDRVLSDYATQYNIVSLI